MKMRTPGLNTAAALAATLLLLAGCETSKLPEQSTAAPVETRQAVATPVVTRTTPATPSGAPQSQVATVDLSKPGDGSGVAGASARGVGGAAAGAAAAMALPSQRVVYFDFDSFVIKGDFQPLIDGYAKVLSINKGKRLVIEGHTDERGGREYNLALGQKRAEAVAKSLKLLGAGDGQMEAVSFGEERPAATGSDESAWAKNRRAELKDR